RRDIGLLCSEGRFTVPMTDGVPAGPLEITSHYYEFIPVDEIDSKTPTILEAHELTEGGEYFILLTTSSGLYRYNISDVMRCVGFQGKTPILEFLNKGQRFSDMEGEKISEYHLVQAVAETAGRLGIRVTGFTAVPIRPDADAGRGVQPTTLDGLLARAPHYVLLLEQQDVRDREQAQRLLAGVDGWLAAHNVMYQGKRSDAYLGPWRLRTIPTGSWTQYDQSEIRRRGVGEDHYKHPCLVLDPAFQDRFRVVEEIVSVQAVPPAVGADP
ncbi:MAG: hypothetical protein ACRC1K_23020, partial [Planctomycetia bacterium]